MTITVYTFRDKDDHETCSFKTQDYQEAKQYASRYGLKVIGNTFEWFDSELMDDFTEANTEEGACQTCDGSGTDEEGVDCTDCQAREACPKCGSPVDYVLPTPTDETFRKCSRTGCDWRMC